MVFPMIGDPWNTGSSLFPWSLVEIASRFLHLAVCPRRQNIRGRSGNFVAALDCSIFDAWGYLFVLLFRWEHTFG